MRLEKKRIGKDDLAHLQAIDDKSIVDNLRQRFEVDEIYVIIITCIVLKLTSRFIAM